ncbi:MAG: PAS domain S-box protein [Gammaproteobacteria bacterium]
MKKRLEGKATMADLRGRAEEHMKELSRVDRSDEVDVRKLLHELQVLQVELELQNSELLEARVEAEAAAQHYTELYDFAPVGYLSLRRDATILQLNLAAAAMLGAERSKLVGKRLGTFVAAEYRPTFNAYVERIFSGHAQQDYELRFQSQAGEAARFVRLSGAADTLWETCRVTMTDVTATRQIMDALAETGSKYRALFENNMDGVLLTTPEGGILAANPEAQNILGYSEDELSKIGRKGVLDYSDPRLAPALAERERTGRYRSGLTALRKDGSRRQLEVASQTFKDRSGRRMSSTIIRDITEFERTRESLVASENKFRTLFDNSRDALLVNSPPEWRFTWANRSAARLFGVEREGELLSMTPWDISPEFQPDGMLSSEKVRQMVEIMLRDGSHSFEWIHKRRDGTTFPAEVLLTRMEVNGEALVLGSIRDISLRKTLEKQVQERRSEMDMLQKTQIATQTAAAIAHELNQPLLAVASYTEAALLMLNAAKPDLAKIRQTIKKGERQALRAGKSMRDLLAHLGSKEFASESFDLNKEIKGTVATIRSEHQLEFRAVFHLEQNLPLVQANRAHMRRVLINLLHNGIEAMQHASVPQPSITVTVRTMKEQNVAQVTIQDNGPGIKQSDIHRLFQPFFSTKPDGIGMGLCISRSLIEANGGQLWIDPDEGPGATFHLTIPFAP